ncbi:helix-turn-helix domain-containing protein [Acrocarpospora catenulata]|uniref:helix-turn-helix domain-containing protein n=1 Tax=Acrocarpospora catenulata TaxID=2836182 RepID=UPI001BD97D0A|nr:AraC family transcriptional regulator [Acrocarpospora catenulata]
MAAERERAAEREHVRAWRPAIRGITEVLHARFTEHAYPLHVHDSWTVLIIDDGMVRYDLDRHEHGALTKLVTVLPPYVPHNGRAASAHGFRKRVLYLDRAELGEEMIGPAVDHPALPDQALRRSIDRLHGVLASPGDILEAESHLALIRERLHHHLGRAEHGDPADPPLARHLRDLLDARLRDGISLDEAARLLHRHPTHLIRAFTREFGMAPHQYQISRRVDLARQLLLQGLPPGTVAAETGFYDQPHLNRHFKRILGVTPARFAASGRRLPYSHRHERIVPDPGGTARLRGERRGLPGTRRPMAPDQTR